jgi:hypothetical protein
MRVAVTSLVAEGSDVRSRKSTRQQAARTGSSWEQETVSGVGKDRMIYPWNYMQCLALWCKRAACDVGNLGTYFVRVVSMGAKSAREPASQPRL